MATSIGGWFDKVFFDSHGKPCAGGTLFFYQTGTDVPSPVATADGTLLGASVKLDDDGRPDTDFRFYADKIYRVVVVDAEGERVTQIDDVAIPESEGGAMYNPMTAQADIIVGGAGGEPTRLEGASSPSFLRSMNSVVGKVLQWVGLTGSNGVKVTNGTSGTEIGLDTTGASEGDALKFVNGAPAWTTDEKGMENPMTTKGDIIVGGASGTPARLGVGADGDILAAALSGGSVSPTWEAGPKKYRNVYNNIPSPQIDDGYLGNLFYLSGYAQTLELPSVADIPSKSFIDFVCLDNAASLAITPQSNTVLNGQNSSITIGGQSASFYRLTFLGRGDVGGVQTDQWALGGGLANGDHKTAVDGSDTSPDYLAAKLAAGTGISLTNTGSAVSIAADAQSGDHHVVVTGADASAGTLADKLVAGSNITLTTNTDGDGVQTLEIAATGGGGGGGSDWDIVPPINNRRYSTGKQYFAIARPVCPLGNTIRSIAFALAPYNSSYSPGVSVTGEIAVYTLNPATDNLWGNAATRIAQKTFSQTIVSPVVWASFDADVDVSDKTKVYAVAVSINRPVAGFTIQLILEHAWGSDGASVPVERHWGDNAHIALNSSMTFSSSTGENFQYWLGVSSRNLG